MRKDLLRRLALADPRKHTSPTLLDPGRHRYFISDPEEHEMKYLKSFESVF